MRNVFKRTALLAFILLFLLSVIFIIRIPKNSLTNETPSNTGSETVEFVSVVYDPGVKSYPDKTKSPYGPDVSPVYNMVKKALVNLNPQDPDNPLSNIIKPGDKVVIKPNLVSKSGMPREECTRTPVLRPIVDFAVEAGASEIIIAEGPADPDPGDLIFGPNYANVTGLVAELHNMYPNVTIGYKNLNQDNFTWINLQENSTFYGVYTAQQLYSKDNIRMDQDSYYYAKDCKGYNPKGYRPGLYAIANTVLKADVFINVPKMKVHHITGVTLSLKNLIGITVSSTGNTTNEEPIKDVPHWNNSDSAHHGEELGRKDCLQNDAIWRVIADLNKIVQYGDENGALRSTKQRKYLSIVDAIIGMEGPYIYGYPSYAQPRPTGVIVAGRDPVAVDAVCSRVMGFNYTVLRSITNVAKISDHKIGIADPASICVVGCSLNNETFWKPYVPHRNYEDPQIVPYKIRLQYFDPPKAILIKTRPGTPRENVETEVIAYTLNIERVATGWLNFSLNGNETQIVKMLKDENAVIAKIGKLNASTNISYLVCMQDFFLNTAWHPELETSVVPSTHPYIEILTPQFGSYNNTVTLTLNVTKGQNDIDTVWYTINESAPTTLETPYTTQLTLVRGAHLITAHVNDTLGHETMDETMVFVDLIHDVAIISVTPLGILGCDAAYAKWHPTWAYGFYIEVVVKNKGTFTENNVVVSLYNGPSLIGATNIASFAPGAQQTLNFSWVPFQNLTFPNLVWGYQKVWPYQTRPNIKATITVVPGDVNAANNELLWGTLTIRYPGDAGKVAKIGEEWVYTPADGKVWVEDLGLFGRWGWGSDRSKTGSPKTKYEAFGFWCDFNADGRVWVEDLAILGRTWGDSPRDGVY